MRRRIINTTLPLSQPFTRRTRLKWLRLSRRVVWLSVSKPSRKGMQAIEKRYASTLASSPRKLSHSLLQVYTIGDDICAISDLSHHYITQKGSYVAIYVREADDWKIRMAYAN